MPPDGFTGIILPVNPPFTRFARISWPTLPGFCDAPTMATLSGEKRCSNICDCVLLQYGSGMMKIRNLFYCIYLIEKIKYRSASCGFIRRGTRDRGNLPPAVPLTECYFNRSARTSEICLTTRSLPCIKAPPRSCMMQPGHSVTSRLAPVLTASASFLSNICFETVGNFPV